MKAYNVSFDYAIYEMSYQNAIMYNRVLPSYDSVKSRDGGSGGSEMIDGDDPDRMNEILSYLD